MNLFKFWKSYFFDQFALHFGGGGGGPSQTTSTVQNTNLPDYARPYVETMLGATQQQLFQGSRGPSTTNPETGEVTQGDFNITGFKPYQAYGGRYDAQGNQLSYDPSKGIAGFQPMQRRAQRGIAGMTLPGEYDQASNATRMAMQNLQRAGYQNSYFGNQFQDPGQFQSGQFNAQQAYAPELQQFQMQGPADVRSQTYNAPSMGTARADFNPRLQNYQMQGPADVRSQGYNASTMGAAQTGYNPQLQNYQMQGPADVRSQGYNAATMGAAQTGYDPQLQAFQMGPAERVQSQSVGTPLMSAAQSGFSSKGLQDFQMGPAERVETQSFAQPGSADAYMSPYMQNVVNIQQREAQRAADIAKTQTNAQAVKAGAFGGSRQAIMDAEAARNLAQQKGDIQATGLQSAFQSAQQQFNTEQQARLAAQQANQQAGLTVGQQNLGARQATQQLGFGADLQTSLANLSSSQQANVQNQAAQLQSQGLNAQQAMQAALANQQAGLTIGQQNLASQQATQQLGAQTGLQTALANLSSQQQANVQNQAAQNQAMGMNAQQALQAALANQQTGLATGQQNLAANLGIQQLGTQTGLQTALANLSNQQQANVQNQAAQNQAMGMNAQQALQAALANQQSGLTTGQQNLAANLGVQQLGTQTGLQTALANLSSEQQANVQNQAAQLQTQGLNAQQAMQAALANQQAGLTTGQQNLSAKLGIQQLGAGQNLQAQLANQQFGMTAQQLAEQSRQFGAGQNMTAAQQRAQYGLAGQQAAEQSRQFGANYGLQANQAALGAANQLAGIGGQRLQGQQGIYNLQNQFGAQQQALEQQKLNQAMQDYANAQQYPLMQLGTMSNMLRGLPMQASSTQQYQAAPNQLSQAIGTIGAGTSIFNAFNPRPPGGAAGGLPKEFKYAKGGGIMSYDMGGEVESQLENMDEKGLEAQAKESSSPSIRRMAQRILRERQMSKQPQVPAMRGGGIIAFQQGAGGNGSRSAIEEGGDEEARIGMAERLAMPPSTTGGIMGAAPQPAAPPPAAPPPAGPLPDIAKEAMRQRDIYSTQASRPTSEFIKEIEAEREAMGVGQNKAREEFRSQQMAERANMKDEQERQKHLRMAEFFANWGSTPGPTLVAGMNALKQSIPGIISDEKDAKKARKEADKIIYDIDEATRLEKLGMYDKATALKEKAAGRAEDYNKYLLTLQAQREANEKSLEVARIQAKGQTDAAAMRNASDRSGRLQVEKLRDEDRIFGRYQAATKEYNDVVADVAKQESQDAHKNDLKKLEQYTAGAKDKKTGEIDPNKINKEYKVLYAQTLERVNARRESWETAIKNAKTEKDIAFKRYKGLSPETAVTQTGPKITPADSGAGTTGNFSAPTAKHIQALKDNPGEAAEFDRKFGPGASTEYLGK